MYPKLEAKEFFDALRQSSIEILKYYKIPTDPGTKVSPWRYPSGPVGITFHYTAGVVWKGSANHLNDPNNRHSSCHMMILDRKVGEVDSIVSRYPILDQLPVTCLMLADLNNATWHGNWSNSYNLGIENRNAGLLKRDDQGRFFWWGNEWTAEFPAAALGKKPVCINGMWWEPYTINQVVANVIVGRYLAKRISGGLDPNWIIPHSAVNVHKLDTGLDFPIKDVRAAILDTTMSLENLVSPSSFLNLSAGRNLPQYSNDYDECRVVDVDSFQGDRSDDGSEVTFTGQPGSMNPENLNWVSDALKNLNWVSDALKNLNWVSDALGMLGYVSGIRSPPNTWKACMTISLKQFQRCMGLAQDGVLGPHTKEALRKRLKDFGSYRVELDG